MYVNIQKNEKKGPGILYPTGRYSAKQLINILLHWNDDTLSYAFFDNNIFQLAR